MTAQANAPVIIKRIRKSGGDAHHGGAWKVAYADFVTAMMAFFMLMWLLGATTEKQRKGIADYFNPTIPVNKVSGGGEGAFGGDSVFSEETLAQNGTGAGLTRATSERQARGQTGVATDDSDSAQPATDPGDQALAEVEDLLQGGSGESMVSELLRRHVVTRLSDEGLIIELFDTAEEALFDGNRPTRIASELISQITSILRIVPNDFAIAGHVASRPIVIRENDAWEMSLARTEAVRTLIEAQDSRGPRVVRVTGHADRKSAVSNRMAPRNNRIELVVLRDRI
jgi:chemotaxis protein MotB